MINKIKKQNVGNAGEYYISALLSAKNFVVTITLGRNIGYDLLIENPKGRALKLSVKARLERKINKFLLNKKCENIIDDNLFYAFIRLNEFKILPDVWIVPSTIVAEFAKSSHKKWLNTPGKKGTKHHDTNMRAFSVEKTEFCPDNWEKELEKYKDNFALLENF